MDSRDVLTVVLVAALAGGLAGFLAGRYSGVSAAVAHFKESGVDTREVRWVDGEEKARLVVGMPSGKGGLLAQYVGEGNPVVTMLDARGAPQAVFVITPNAIQHAAGF